MAKDDCIEFDGEVVDTLPNTTFRVKLETDMWSSPTFLARCAKTTFVFLQVTRLRLR